MYYEENGEKLGVLNDWDLATDHTQPELLSVQALRLLLDYHGRTPHLYRDDIESMWCVLVWVSLGYNEKGLYQRDNPVDSWRVGDNGQMSREEMVSPLMFAISDYMTAQARKQYHLSWPGLSAGQPPTEEGETEDSPETILKEQWAVIENEYLVKRKLVEEWKFLCQLKPPSLRK
ncbi:hypothetical protein K474DRAFT_1662416 [Panus rudis PR-1116 ss-1]|nr:hypothetical protein K474DRAFT_1662379 [Panus rudis PR-1116 ss-1]KAI0076857.1 hypothetical protein K474DRAFT_1662416 [Panus rudis PR-1116 ss-1]